MRGFLVVQYTIHTEANAKLFLERFQVNVTGPQLKGLRDHAVDKANDRGLACHVAQVLDLNRVGIVDRAEYAVARFFLLAEIFVYRVENFPLGRQYTLDVESAELT